MFGHRRNLRESGFVSCKGLLCNCGSSPKMGLFSLDHSYSGNQQQCKIFSRKYKVLNKGHGNQKKPYGFTMVELLVALVVIAVLTGVIFGIYSKNHDTADAQKMNADLITIVQGTKSAFAHDSQGYAAIATIGTLVSLGIIPGDLNITGADEGATVKNQFGGKVVTEVDPEGGWFKISYEKVPAKVCIKVLTTLNSDSFSQISAGSTPIYDNGATGGTATPYLGTVAIKDACGTGVVTMTFTAQ